MTMINVCGMFAVCCTYVGDVPQSADSCMMELECSSINANVELRPRSGGFKIGLCVQDLYLRDRTTAGSLCPSLIEPVKKVITDHPGACVSEFMYFGVYISKYQDLDGDCMLRCTNKIA